MYFTKDDFQKIEDYFKQVAYKDTDFRYLRLKNVNDNDIVAVVHNGNNRKITFKDLALKVGQLVTETTLTVSDDEGNSRRVNTLAFETPLKVDTEGLSEDAAAVKLESDNTLDNTSTNPVQNKVVTGALDSKQNKSDFLSYYDINNIIYDVFGF